MPRAFESRVFSSETLIAGMSLVQNGAGMDSLEGMDDESMELELKRLEDGCMAVCWGMVCHGYVFNLILIKHRGISYAYIISGFCTA